MIDDHYFMSRCFLLAKRSRYAAPNPKVGCVIVHNSRIIGEGYHVQQGEAHAEINALNSIRKEDLHLLKSATVYVSLEPCNHFGKTGPCSDALVEAGVSKVIVATPDPNPKTHKAGIKKLRSHGIEVEVGLLENEALEILRDFKVYQFQKRAYVCLKYALSKSGIFAPNNGQFWLSGLKTRIKTHQWRNQFDAILVGSRTARIDNPILDSRLAEGPDPVRIVVDRYAKLSPELNIFQSAHSPLLVCTCVEEYPINLRHVEPILFRDGFSIKKLVKLLYEREIYSLIIEGGSVILNEAIKENIWDECRIIHTPTKLEAGLKIRNIDRAPIKFEMSGKDSIEYYYNQLDE